MVVLDTSFAFIWNFCCASKWCSRKHNPLQKRTQTRRPLSPLLFVLAADCLQSMINEAKCMGLLSVPLPLNSNVDFSVIQYADDKLIIMEGDARQQLHFLKSLLNSFSESTSLRVNFNKSMMVQINIFEEKLQHLASTFGCAKGSLPTY